MKNIPYQSTIIGKHFYIFCNGHTSQYSLLCDLSLSIHLKPREVSLETPETSGQIFEGNKMDGIALQTENIWHHSQCSLRGLLQLGSQHWKIIPWLLYETEHDCCWAYMAFLSLQNCSQRAFNILRLYCWIKMFG